ncbi:MAG TPA: thiamine pyrophosphate-dependent enzyme [Methanothrix sp.]|nr:thiamine pyrophosphate-dependent enzyme [Methanothrix sp.]
MDALGEALTDLRIDLRIYVPGYPITEAVPALGRGAQMAANEKVALEVALGASATGRRSMVLVKHLGANLLSDPLSIAPTHAIGAGLVVLVGEDVGPKGSQAEADVRNYGPLCEIPVLDPACPGLLGPALKEAYTLSERIRGPVMVRTTFEFKEAVNETIKKADVPAFGPFPGGADEKDEDTFATFDRSIWDLTAKGRHMRYRGEALPAMRSASSESSLNFFRDGSGKIGIIASGRPGSLALKLTSTPPLLVVGYSHPLPWEMIQDFVRKHDSILVAEEPAPFIEARLHLCENVLGKMTGHLPWGKMEGSDLERALDLIASGKEPGPAPSPQRFVDRLNSRNVCDDCPFRPVYQAVGGLSVPVAGDAGCSIRAVRPPLEAVDVVYGLGSSVAVASGFSRKGVALVGDYALAHSGLLGLIDAANNRREVLVVLLNNGVAAMTGGQPVPDITRVLEAIVPDLRTIDLPASREEIEEVLEDELAKPGISLVVARGACPRYDPAT